MIFTFTACGGGGGLTIDDDDDNLTETFLSKEEALAKLTNYSFEYKFVYEDEDEERVTKFVDKHTTDAHFYSWDTVIYLADNRNNAFYMLFSDQKTGYIIETVDFDDLDWVSYFFNWHEYATKINKVGDEVFLGRACNV